MSHLINNQQIKLLLSSSSLSPNYNKYFSYTTLLIIATTVVFIMATGSPINSTTNQTSSQKLISSSSSSSLDINNDDNKSQAKIINLIKRDQENNSTKNDDAADFELLKSPSQSLDEVYENNAKSLQLKSLITTTNNNDDNNISLIIDNNNQPSSSSQIDQLSATQSMLELSGLQQQSLTSSSTTLTATSTFDQFRHSITVSVILTIAYTIVFIVGIVGNSFVVAIVCKSPRMRTVTNYFIANLALADILVLLFCLPATLVSNLFVPYVLGLFVCKTVSYLQGVAVSASINTMVAVTMDRFLAICFPMDWHLSRRGARWTIACIWLFSSSISIPWALYFTLVPFTFEHKQLTIHVCAEVWPSERLGVLYFVCANLILCYLLPATVIILCYLGIWYKIERRNIPGDGPKGMKVELIIQKSKIKVVKMMMVVVVIFLLSWLPLYIIFIRIKFAEERSVLEDWLITNLMPLAQWLGASNSCINPILYTFFNRKYRQGFIDLLCFGYCCKSKAITNSINNNGNNNNNNNINNTNYNNSNFVSCRQFAAAGSTAVTCFNTTNNSGCVIGTSGHSRTTNSAGNNICQQSTNIRKNNNNNKFKRNIHELENKNIDDNNNNCVYLHLNGINNNNNNNSNSLRGKKICGNINSNNNDTNKNTNCSINMDTLNVSRRKSTTSAAAASLEEVLTSEEKEKKKRKSTIQSIRFEHRFIDDDDGGYIDLDDAYDDDDQYQENENNNNNNNNNAEEAGGGEENLAENGNNQTGNEINFRKKRRKKERSIISNYETTTTRNLCNQGKSHNHNRHHHHHHKEQQQQQQQKRDSTSRVEATVASQRLENDNIAQISLSMITKQHHNGEEEQKSNSKVPGGGDGNGDSNGPLNLNSNSNLDLDQSKSKSKLIFDSDILGLKSNVMDLKENSKMTVRSQFKDDDCGNINNFNGNKKEENKKKNNNKKEKKKEEKKKDKKKEKSFGENKNCCSLNSNNNNNNNNSKSSEFNQFGGTSSMVNLFSSSSNSSHSHSHSPSSCPSPHGISLCQLTSKNNIERKGKNEEKEVKVLGNISNSVSSNKSENYSTTNINVESSNSVNFKKASRLRNRKLLKGKLVTLSNKQQQHQQQNFSPENVDLPFEKESLLQINTSSSCNIENNNNNNNNNNIDSNDNENKFESEFVENEYKTKNENANNNNNNNNTTSSSLIIKRQKFRKKRSILSSRSSGGRSLKSNNSTNRDITISTDITAISLSTTTNGNGNGNGYASAGGYSNSCFGSINNNNHHHHHHHFNHNSTTELPEREGVGELNSENLDFRRKNSNSFMSLKLNDGKQEGENKNDCQNYDDKNNQPLPSSSSWFNRFNDNDDDDDNRNEQKGMITSLPVETNNDNYHDYVDGNVADGTNLIFREKSENDGLERGKELGKGYCGNNSVYYDYLDDNEDDDDDDDDDGEEEEEDYEEDEQEEEDEEEEEEEDVESFNDDENGRKMEKL